MSSRGIVVNGYRLLYKKGGHHRASPSGYVPEHILVFEDHYKCCVPRYAVIHHINGHRRDNRIENLVGMIRSKHTSMHQRYVKKVTEHRQCAWCLSDKTYIRKPDRNRFSARQSWYGVFGEWTCAKCRSFFYSLTKYYICQIYVDGKHRKIYI